VSGGSPVPPEDLVDQLRFALDEREQGMTHREIDARLVVEPRERWEQHHYAAAERLERLRTIQAHREILGRHERGHWCVGTGRAGRMWWPNGACEDVRSIAAIYLPDAES
jgi:hypothetical protein